MRFRSTANHERFLIHASFESRVMIDPGASGALIDAFSDAKRFEFPEVVGAFGWGCAPAHKKTASRPSRVVGRHSMPILAFRICGHITGW
jgi:hypothetical protein